MYTYLDLERFWNNAQVSFSPELFASTINGVLQVGFVQRGHYIHTCPRTFLPLSVTRFPLGCAQILEGMNTDDLAVPHNEDMMTQLYWFVHASG